MGMETQEVSPWYGHGVMRDIWYGVVCIANQSRTRNIPGIIKHDQTMMLVTTGKN